MNLSDDKRRFQGGDSGAGDGLGTVAHAGPAHPLAVGAVGFGPAWTMEDSMAASIVRLEQELEEANARIAVLEEEQRILAKGSGADRPEPSAHFCSSCGVAWAAHLGIAGTCEALRQALEERDEARLQYRSTEALAMALVKTINEMKEERVDLKLKITALRDQLCADKCRDKSQADGGWGNI